jgi:integrase/recombinase XerD
VSLNLWRRHNPQKCNFTSRSDRKCRCVIWVTGSLPSGERVRESTRLRDWTRAEAVVRRWEVEGAQPLQSARTTIAEWQDAFLQDASSPAGKNLNSETLRKYKLLFRQINEFANDRGMWYVNQLNLNELTAFRSRWKDAPLSASKKLERLRSVLKFALRRKWINENPATDLDPPKIKPTPTLPYTADEMQRISKASTDPRVHTFILVMRYSGLRISDTTALAVESLTGNKLRLYQAKTGEHVSIPLPEHAAAALRSIPHNHPSYFFWTGHSKIPAAASVWRKRLAAVFKKAGIRNGHSHRFRDTFAVGLLEAGVSLESVSILLGHQNLKITQKAYSPWVKSRQDALDKEIEKAYV